MVTVEFLHSVSIFARLEQQQLQAILEKIQPQHYHRGEVIFHQGDPADRMHIIVEGRVRISIASEDGRETNLALLQSRDCFGEMALLDNCNRSATATAILPAETIVLFRPNFLDFLSDNPQVASEVNGMLIQRLRTLAETYAAGTAEDAVIIVPIGQDELAQLVGASRETVSRALNSYRRMGILNTSHRRIAINDMTRLKRMSSF